jgi:ABC-type multidrug transport system fused ATPase/permease subunit
MFLPYYIGKLIDAVGGPGGGDQGPSAARQSLDKSVLVLLAILLVGSVFTFVRGTLFNLAGERLVARVRTQLFASLVQQDVGFFDQAKTGELMNRLSADTTGLCVCVCVCVCVITIDGASLLSLFARPLSLLLINTHTHTHTHTQSSKMPVPATCP